MSTSSTNLHNLHIRIVRGDVPPVRGHFVRVSVHFTFVRGDFVVRSALETKLLRFLAGVAAVAAKARHPESHFVLAHLH